MERRVPPSRRIVHGATLTVSTMGGYSVTHRGDYLGYLHASLGNQFNVYQRKVNELDVHLGRASVQDGVWMILRACGRVVGSPPDKAMT